MGNGMRMNIAGAIDNTRCVYCGTTSASTRDHIPPKCLFPTPRPSDLITVPACAKCNSSASKDDEYFRLVLSLRWDTSQNPAANAVSEAAIRQLLRPEGRVFAESFFRGLQEVCLSAPGLSAPIETGLYDVDMKRLNRVGRRILLGLYAHHCGARLPDTCSTRVWCLDALGTSRGEAFANVSGMLRRFVGREFRSVAAGAFRYSFMRVKDSHDHPDSSVWLFCFYGVVLFLGTTMDSPTAGKEKPQQRAAFLPSDPQPRPSEGAR